MSDPRSYVRVALPLPLDQTFTYAVDGGPLRPGTRVLVPFQRQERIGLVVGQGGEEGIKRIRTVLSVMDTEPSVGESQLRLARWMADYYVTSLGIALKTMLPSVLTDASSDVVTLLDGPRGKLSQREARIVQALTPGTSQSLRALKRGLRMGSIWPEIRTLAAAGLVSVETLPPRPPPVKTARVVRVARWIDDIEELNALVGRARRQADAYQALAGSGGTVELAHLTGQAGFSRGVIRGLEEKGLALVEDREVERDPFASIPVGGNEAHTDRKSVV